MSRIMELSHITSWKRLCRLSFQTLRVPDRVAVAQLLTYCPVVYSGLELIGRIELHSHRYPSFQETCLFSDHVAFNMFQHAFAHEATKMCVASRNPCAASCHSRFRRPVAFSFVAFVTWLSDMSMCRYSRPPAASLFSS